MAAYAFGRLRWGVMVARRAWLQPADVLNTRPLPAFRAALRIPNFLQTLFGEGVLSASFIPVYSSLLASVFDGAMGAWHNANRNNRSPMAPCRRAHGQYVPGGERVGTARKNAPLPTLRCWSL